MVSFENDVGLVIAKENSGESGHSAQSQKLESERVGWAGLGRTLVTQQKENAFFLY